VIILRQCPSVASEPRARAANGRAHVQPRQPGNQPHRRLAKEFGLSCFSVARASSRTRLSRGVGDNQLLRVELTYTDDDGQTWSPFIEIPYLDGLGCPKMAAAGDEAYLHWRPVKACSSRA
jgi:hypothetical protein